MLNTLGRENYSSFYAYEWWLLLLEIHLIKRNKSFSKDKSADNEIKTSSFENKNLNFSSFLAIGIECLWVVFFYGSSFKKKNQSNLLSIVQCRKINL